MACNWLMMTSSGEDNWPWGFGSAHRQKKKPKAEQETAQPMAAQFNYKHDYSELYDTRSNYMYY